VLAGGLKTWGHESWSDRPFHVELPALTDPARTTVLITEDDPPWAWLAVAFPPSVAFAQTRPNFPTGPAYSARIREMATQRGGAAFALFQGGHYDSSVERVDRVRDIAERWGFTRSSTGCAALIRIAKKLRIRASVNMAADAANGTSCRLDLLPGNGGRDIESENRAEREKAERSLRPYGLALSGQDCTLHRAGIGDVTYLFQWCPIIQATAP
jgi:hypothetical protein